MSSSVTKKDILQPSTLQEAINVIKFLNTSHKQQIIKLKEAYLKQSDIIKKLESNRKKELEFLSKELQKYELNLAIRTETVAKQLEQKDEIIQNQADLIEELKNKLKIQHDLTVPEITIASVDSNSDSVVALENEDGNIKSEVTKVEIKSSRKCSRRIAESISFLRRVDFSPMKYKPSNREGNKKKDEKKASLQVPLVNKRFLTRQFSNERPLSDDDRTISAETVFSDSAVEHVVIKTKKINDSMNNYFSDDGSEDTSEELFDRVMTRNSIRRSVKANPKYKKINRAKSKLLEQVKVNIVD